MAGDVRVNIVGVDKLSSVAQGAEGRLGSFGKRAKQASEETASGFERAGESADKGELRILGMKDAVDGAATIMQGPGKAGITAYIQGWADLASGFANFIFPSLQALKANLLTNIRTTAASTVATARNTAASVASAVASRAAAVATRVMAVAQWALNAAMRANPIGIVITVLTLLAVAIVVAYNRSARFRAIVQSVWASLKAGVSTILGVLGALGRLGAAMFNFGKNAVLSFINGIRSQASAVLAAIKAIIPDPIERFLHLSSPAKEGPLSKDGGPEGWGKKAADLWARGFARGGSGVPRLAGGLAGNAVLAGAGGPSITINATTNASASDIARELAWTLKTSGR